MNSDTMPAGRELDAIVAEKVMGARRYYADEVMYAHNPHYSTDIAAAWEIYKEMMTRNAERFIDRLTYFGNNKSRESMLNDVLKTLSPFLICRAALLAVNA